MSSKIVPQIFKILFQTGHVNIFVRRGVIFKILFQTGHVNIFVRRGVICSRYVQR